MPRVDTTVEYRRQQVATRYLRGELQSEIARVFGVSQQQISQDLKAIRSAWLASAIRDFDALKAEELARVDTVEREAWAAWTRSQTDKQIAIQEQYDDPVTTKDEKGRTAITSKVRKHASLRKEGQTGAPSFLEIILKCIAKRCEILGLDAPRKFNININWDELSGEQIDRLAAGEPPEKVLAA
jgi:transcriptional regulator with XRE-family HTH domain